MRARNIKPGLCTNEILGAADPLIQLLFACLPMVADRDGKIEDRPLRIKAAIFPYRDVKIEPLLNWLEKNGFIERYEVSGIKVIYISGFRKHQSPHHTERMSELPNKPLNINGSSEITVDAALQDGGNPPDSLIPDSLIPDSAVNIFPDWLPLEDWHAFVEMRKAIKKPMTDRAAQMIIKKIASFKGSPSAILQQSIINNWQDVFELRQEKSSQFAKPHKELKGLVV